MTPDLAAPGVHVVISKGHGGRLVGARGVIARVGEPWLYNPRQRRDEPVPEPILVRDLWVSIPGARLPDGRPQHDILICCRDAEMEA